MRGLYKYLRMKKICCIGHITLDKIITPKSEVEMPGGTSFYFAHGIHNLNPDANFQLVTAVAQSEMKSVDDIRALGVDVVVLPTRHTVFFENKYGENQNNRTQRVLAKADPFTVQSLQGIEADIYHLGSLLADDFSLDVFEMLSAKARCRSMPRAICAKCAARRCIQSIGRTSATICAMSTSLK